MAFDLRGSAAPRVVGGGPTGVEVAADLADFIASDAVELYPKLMEYISVKLINTGKAHLDSIHLKKLFFTYFWMKNRRFSFKNSSF